MRRGGKGELVEREREREARDGRERSMERKLTSGERRNQ